MNSTIPADLLELKARFETWRTNRKYLLPSLEKLHQNQTHARSSFGEAQDNICATRPLAFTICRFLLGEEIVHGFDG